MLIFVKTRFKGSSREVKYQVKQHETQTLSKLSNQNAWQKKGVFLKKNKQTCAAYFLFPVNTEQVIKHDW